MLRTVAYIRVNAIHTLAYSLEQRVLFPSFMVPAHPESLASMRHAHEPDVVTVEVNGLYFTAGRDSLHFEPTHPHTAWRHFTLSQIGHLALIRTALWYLRKPQLDLLIVGLPLASLVRHQKSLTRGLPGTHPMPLSRHPSTPTFNDTSGIEIQQVWVLPQAVVALLAASYEHPVIQMSEAVVLDFGLHALDLLCAANLRPVAKQQGCIRGGVLGYINRLAGVLVQHGPGEAPSQIPKFTDTDCWTGGSASLAQPLRQGRALLNDYLDQALTQVPAARDMRTAVVTGSGARLIAPLLADRLPRLTQVITPRTPEHTLLQNLAQAN